MKCSQCGGDVPDSSSFCPHCGTAVGGAAAASAPGRATAAARLRPGNASPGNQPAEEELWSGTYSPKAMIGWFVGAGLLTIAGAIVASLAGGAAWVVFAIGAIIAWAVVALVTLYRRLTVRYQLTTFRLFHETGLLSRTRDRIEVIDVDDVTMTQGLIERMFNVGTVTILASDQSLSEKEGGKGGMGTLSMQGIDDPRRVTDLIDNTRRRERERRAIFMENV
jgi:membrane protein YdbS with pleckstrin-like domain